MTITTVQSATLLVSVLMCTARLAAAQEIPLDAQRNPIRAEFGVFTSALPAQTIGVGLRAGIATKPRVGVELVADWVDGRRRAHYPDQIVWLYTVQAKHRLRTSEDDRTTIFATYGATGWVERVGRRDGVHTMLIPPFVPTAGFGVQRKITSRLALRGDVHVLWMFGGDMPGAVFRVSGGMSLLLGA